jgi:flagellar biosynthesis protein FlhG
VEASGPKPPRAGRIIAVGGGKGGVGKSIISANLAVAMGQLGRRVILVDGDLGGANVHTLFGITRPGPTVQALLDRSIDDLGPALVPTDVRGVAIIPGSVGVDGAADLAHAQRRRLLGAIARLEADCVILDIGAGVAASALDFFDLADLRVTVMTPQLTSIQNAYAFLKAAVHRTLHNLGEDHGTRARVDDVTRASRPTEPLSSMLLRLHRVEPSLGNRADAALRCFGARIIGNLIFSDQDATSLRAVSRMITDYLGLEPHILGWLRATQAMNDAVNDRRPFVLDHPHTQNGRTLRQMAWRLLTEDVARLRQERAGAHEPTPPEPSAPAGEKLAAHLRPIASRALRHRAALRTAA